MTRQEIGEKLVRLANECRPQFNAISDLLLEVEDVVANEAEADAIIVLV